MQRGRGVVPTRRLVVSCCMKVICVYRFVRVCNFEGQQDSKQKGRNAIQRAHTRIEVELKAFTECVSRYFK